MPQTLTNVLVHVIFSTQHRAPSIVEEIQPHLFAYIGGILKQTGCQPIIVGGHDDHVHLLFVLAKDKGLSETMRVVKSNSSKWVKEAFPGSLNFAWQAGYAGYSVGYSDVNRVRLYIERQKVHHAVTSFQDELRAICRKEGIEIDERYLWD